MTDEKTMELFTQYKQTGDVKLRDKIAEKYLYVADIVAKKFAGRGVEYDDLRQVAALALIKGIDRFDPSRGLQFSTFITLFMLMLFLSFTVIVWFGLDSLPFILSPLNKKIHHIPIKNM